MQSPSLQPEPTPGTRARSLATVAHQAARTVRTHAVGGVHGLARAPWCEPVADLPAYVPVFGSTDWSAERLRLANLVVARHRATTTAAPDAAAAVELAAAGIHIYAQKLLEPTPDRDPVQEWEHTTRFGPSAVYAGMRTLAAAVLTARAVSGWLDYAVHLEAVRRWWLGWLVDWIADGDQLRAPGPDDGPELLDALGKAVADCGDLADRSLMDGEVLARLWGAIAGPGPEMSPLHRRQGAGRRVLLLDLADPYLQDRARHLPTWSPTVTGPEESVLAGEPSALPARVEASMTARDRAVLHAYLAGDRTWTQAAATAAPTCEEAEALGERVRRLLKRFGLEDQRRRAARHTPALDRRGPGASR
jgi:hypothetical protein